MYYILYIYIYNFICILKKIILKVNYIHNYIIEYNRLQNTSQQLDTYIQLESWKYCQNCHIVEPNNMLPNFGHQKIGFLKHCICQKGRYFVPMVIENFFFYFSFYIKWCFFFQVLVYLKLKSIKVFFCITNSSIKIRYSDLYNQQNFAKSESLLC